LARENPGGAGTTKGKDNPGRNAKDIAKKLKQALSFRWKQEGVRADGDGDAGRDDGEFRWCSEGKYWKNGENRLGPQGKAWLGR
jgi:hypothetical protein